MQRLIILILVAAMALPAQAGPGRGPGFDGPRGHGGFDWLGLAIFGAITTLIFVSEQNRQPPQPLPAQQPVYIEPPASSAPPAPQTNTWYYCGSSGQYYPYTQACPEGWQAVPANPGDR